MLREHSKQMLTGLHPARSSSCLIEHHIFQYDNHKINMYSIQHDHIDDWKNSNRPIILYFHGGGFVFGGIDTYSGFECHLSKDLNMLVLHVNFGLVPEYSLVNTIKDVIDVYRILMHVDPNIHQRLIGMGDSSGGMLWIYLLQWIVSNNKPVPRAVVLHSPWPSLDFLNVNARYIRDGYLSSAFVFRLRQLAIGKDKEWFKLTDEEKRQLSPEKNSFQGFPPLYITVGTNEIFTDEIRTMTKKMELAGVRVKLDEGEGLMHTYALFHLWSLKAKCVQRKIRQWVEEELLMNKKPTWTVKTQSDFFC
jgi:acetyl esterase/lipase